MRIELVALVAVSAVLATPAATWAETSAEGNEARSDGEYTGPSAAVGISTSWLKRQDYGDRSRNTFAPELLGFAYLDTAIDRLYLRPGARLGYTGLRPAQMPKSARFVERDGALAAELGAAYDGVVVPVAAVGGGVVVRRLSLVLDPSIETDADPIARWEVLPVAYAQVAAGVPFAKGRLMLEPFTRFEFVAGDNRARWRYGLDITVELY